MHLMDWHQCRKWTRAGYGCPYDGEKDHEPDDDREIDIRVPKDLAWPEFYFLADKLYRQEKELRRKAEPVRVPTPIRPHIPDTIPEEIPPIAAILREDVAFKGPFLSDWPESRGVPQWSRPPITATSPALARAPSLARVAVTQSQTSRARTTATGDVQLPYAYYSKEKSRNTRTRPSRALSGALATRASHSESYATSRLALTRGQKKRRRSTSTNYQSNRSFLDKNRKKIAGAVAGAATAATAGIIASGIRRGGGGGGFHMQARFNPSRVLPASQF